MYHIIYKTTNTINKKWYIGYHSTTNINDEYLGSGKLIISAIKKYGKESFIKEILYIFPTKEEALLKEKELVNEDIVNDRSTYNSKIGGEGGWDHILKRIKEDIEFKKKMYLKVSKTLKNSYASGKIKGWSSNGKVTKNGKSSGFKNKKHTDRSKKLMSKNNGNLLSVEEINNRIIDIKNEKEKFGYIGRLSKKWKVSHTTVRRFINSKNAMGDLA